MNDGPDHPEGEPLDTLDTEALGGLRELHARLDPVPAGLADEVKFALTVQALQAEVAELTRLGADESAVRTVDYTRAETLSFSGGPFTAMVTIVDRGPGSLRIDGWVTGGAVRVELRQRDRTSTIDVEEDGRFVFEDVEHGLVQFVLHPLQGGGRPVITPSIDL